MSIYSDAIKILKERGWHQGGLVGQDGSVCVFGAVCVAAGLKLDYNWVGEDDIITEKIRNDLLNIIGEGAGPWNDRPWRTREDVIALLVTADETYGEVDNTLSVV